MVHHCEEIYISDAFLTFHFIKRSAHSRRGAWQLSMQGLRLNWFFSVQHHLDRPLLTRHVQRRGQRKAYWGSQVKKTKKKHFKDQMSWANSLLGAGGGVIFTLVMVGSVGNWGEGVFTPFWIDMFWCARKQQCLPTQSKEPIEPRDRPEEVVSAGFHSKPGVVCLQWDHDWPSSSANWG